MLRSTIPQRGLAWRLDWSERLKVEWSGGICNQGWSEAMSPGVIPVAKAVYLCDDAVLDSPSNKIHLVGLFNSVAVEEAAFPFALGKLCVFAQLTDGLGEFRANVEIVNARSGEALYRTPEHELVFSSRKQL